MYKWFLFDLDGTLTNTKEGIINCLVYAFEGMGVDYGEREALKRYIGPPLMESFSNYFDQEGCVKAVELFRERYETKGINECELFGGIKEMLKAAKESGKMTALATSQPEKFAKMILENFGILQYIDIVSGAIDDTTTKTDVINTALERAGIGESGKNTVLMVGDRKYDIEGANECGIDAVGVYYGFADPLELERAGAKYVVNTVEELKEMVSSSSLDEIDKYKVK